MVGGSICMCMCACICACVFACVRVRNACVPLANIGRISGLPQLQVCLLSLKTESNSTGFSFQPTNTQSCWLYQGQSPRERELRSLHHANYFTASREAVFFSLSHFSSLRNISWLISKIGRFIFWDQDLLYLHCN